MALEVDFSKLKTSWTKFDIVQVMDVLYSRETLNKFINREAKLDEPILRSFLGMKSLKDPIPNHWLEIQNHPSEKKLFSLFSIIFTHGEVVKKFSDDYSAGDMKGLFVLENGKQFTNIRSALIESGAAEPFLRRAKEVPFDFSPIFQNVEVGKLFKKVLEERISRLTNEKISKADFYKICFSNNFHKALSISTIQFRAWLEGKKVVTDNYIKSVEISKFYSIEEIKLDTINNCKEVYFLGENGDGKSLVLMAIFLAFNRHFVINQTDKEKTGKVLDIMRDNMDLELKGIDDRNKVYANKNVGFLSNFFCYGTHRGRFSTDESDEYGFMSLFDNDQTLVNPETWLKTQKAIELEKLSDKNETKISSQKELQANFSTELLEKMFHEILERNVEIKISASNVSFVEKGMNLSFEQLSEGYKSTIIFISDLLSRLQRNQSEVNNIEDLHGIVLVDEIDLHLHPKWQRFLVAKLRLLLPNVQFMFTTHSPTIVQGASNDAILYRVYRNSEDGKTRISEPYYRKNLNHLMINTLLTSPLFGLDNSRLDTDNENADTSDSYFLYMINEKLELKLEQQKKEGKEFISEEKIDSLIQGIIEEELKKK
ncbi:AAA family ATPase [Zobellia galactanivorans]|uniref:AAA family ATPase n=1 Tax=Zobellia galactanivorans (strain DSM 12802 / CCUG 47099 / CIP 106680 / NCIMB 13871 / Dsij) TaxID=63186 RepID=UPI0026E2237A|nr:AAA family ATPase [Zobellia galactanivorans]MDO6808880.1 AAA family ATPase [Zobellia galactanivorans]